MNVNLTDNEKEAYEALVAANPDVVYTLRVSGGSGIGNTVEAHGDDGTVNNITDYSNW